MVDLFGNLISCYVVKILTLIRNLKNKYFFKNQTPVKQTKKKNPLGPVITVLMSKVTQQAFEKTWVNWSLGKYSRQQFLKVVLVSRHIFLEIPLLWISQRNASLTLLSVVIRSMFTGDKYSLSDTEDWRNLRETNENI